MLLGAVSDYGGLRLEAGADTPPRCSFRVLGAVVTVRGTIPAHVCDGRPCVAFERLGGVSATSQRQAIRVAPTVPWTKAAASSAASSAWLFACR